MFLQYLLPRPNPSTRIHERKSRRFLPVGSQRRSLSLKLCPSFLFPLLIPLPPPFWPPFWFSKKHHVTRPRFSTTSLLPRSSWEAFGISSSRYQENPGALISKLGVEAAGDGAASCQSPRRRPTDCGRTGRKRHFSLHRPAMAPAATAQVGIVVVVVDQSSNPPLRAFNELSKKKPQPRRPAASSRCPRFQTRPEMRRRGVTTCTRGHPASKKAQVKGCEVSSLLLLLIVAAATAIGLLLSVPRPTTCIGDAPNGIGKRNNQSSHPRILNRQLPFPSFPFPGVIGNTYQTRAPNLVCSSRVLHRKGQPDPYVLSREREREREGETFGKLDQRVFPAHRRNDDMFRGPSGLCNTGCDSRDGERQRSTRAPARPRRRSPQKANTVEESALECI